MTRLAALALAFALAAQPALAQDPLDAIGFDTATLGKTFTFSGDNGPYGAEQYMPGHRVLWSFLDGRCQEGTWYQQGQFICFVYENDPQTHCWTFFDQAGQLVAHFNGDPEDTTLYSTTESDEPLYCMGPDVGV